MDPDAGAEVAGVAFGMADVVPMGQKDVGAPFPGLEGADDGARPARRVHHQVARRPADQEGMGSVRRARVVAEAMDAVGHGLREATVWHLLVALGPDRGGRTGEPRAPRLHPFFRRGGLPGEDRLATAANDQPGRQRARRRAVDAAGVDVPVAGGVEDVSVSHWIPLSRPSAQG